MNPKWVELTEMLPAGCTAYDCPEITNRVFKMKLDAFLAELNIGSVWSPTLVFTHSSDPSQRVWTFSLRRSDMPNTAQGYQVSVIEFQKRGLPHAHIVFSPAFMLVGAAHTAAPEGTPQLWADQFTCAQKPTPDVLAQHGLLVCLPSGSYGISKHVRAINYRDMQRMCPKARFYINRRSPSTSDVCLEMKSLVCGERACMDGYSSISRNRRRTSGPMEHGPHPFDDCRPAKWCKQTSQGFCKSCFPRPCGGTRKVENGFIELKRRTGPEFHCGWSAGDEFIVASNVWMLFKYKTHINVEIAAKVSVIAYLYKYLFKGGDRARFEVRRDAAAGAEVVDDEIADWKQGMYTSAAEACWILMEFDKFNNSPVVDVLDMHLINSHSREQAPVSSEFEKYVFRPAEVDRYAREHLHIVALTATEFKRHFMATATPPADVIQGQMQSSISWVPCGSCRTASSQA
ncbi:hypothetical protein CYMTET_41538 [Cymbomonas tetramitiformis]|uniref:Helitron helicase-like domain-containing protein n=1 Tax=Cymbomonas tetramitiformis TaxID=36881 RepID=A0AAE0C7W0_9CHLO|nr:hypothetical protein CYMTET_41538 [Cymbomonas tetramitiformis]